MKRHTLVLPLIFFALALLFSACYQVNSSGNMPVSQTKQDTATATPEQGRGSAAEESGQISTKEPTEVPLTATEEPVLVRPTATPTEEPTPTPTLNPTPTSVPTEIPMYVGFTARDVEVLRQDCLSANLGSLCLPLPSMPAGDVIHDTFVDLWNPSWGEKPDYVYEGEQSRLLIPFSAPSTLVAVRNSTLKVMFCYLDDCYNMRADLPLGGVMGIEVAVVNSEFPVRETWYKVSDLSECNGENITSPRRRGDRNFKDGDISLNQSNSEMQISTGDTFAQAMVPLCLEMNYYVTVNGSPMEKGAITPSDLLHTHEGSIVYVLPNP